MTVDPMTDDLFFMKQELVKKILKDTEVGYELISEKFSQTRH
ncbi:MAG: hypothetical protein ACD_7C00055G0001, partial [uncultured bacterium]